MSQRGPMKTTFTARGLPRYEIEISNPELHKFQLIRGDDPFVVEQKATTKMAEWDARSSIVESKRKCHESAEERTSDARAQLERLECILAETLSVDDTVDWDLLKDRGEFPEPKPQMPTLLDIGAKPKRLDPQFAPRLGFLDQLFQSRKAKRQHEAEQRFLVAHEDWERNARMKHAQNEKAKAWNKDAMQSWIMRREEYIRSVEQANSSIDRKKEAYLSGDAEAVLDYCDIVLSNSRYPDYFPQSYNLDYSPENKLIVIEYRLPALTDLPTLSEVKWVQSRSELVEKHITEKKRNELYDKVLYQVALRTIHELCESDTASAIDLLVFNGLVESIDPATGKEVVACVLSIQVTKEEFLQINLANIEPKSCFRKLKGVGSSQLHSLTPVAPILTIDKGDSRFIASYAVVDRLDEGDNLAAMPWEDFEHLIREMFEKEFAQAGGEVRVTRASRDGGVDAVIFDPDPLRGGKIVVQAKRYTNTVGVSAVRDLYGTLMNEGANKGILVTTSDYGPDAYEFAKGKPLVLLSGSNLLHLLEKHGHKAKIDLVEAKKLMLEH